MNKRANMPKPKRKAPPEELSPLKRLERRIDTATGFDLTTARGRRRARWSFNWMDHAILRTFWTNFYQIAPGVWRSNHPGDKRLARYKAMGIDHIVNLRGRSKRAHHVFEREACERLGINLIDVHLAARKLVSRDVMLGLIDLFDTIPRPFVMHCKSGADRAGLAAAIYLIHVEGKSIDQARRQMSARYLHFRFSSTGILDFLLERYARDNCAAPITIRDWFVEKYDPVTLMEDYQARRKGRTPNG